MELIPNLLKALISQCVVTAGIYWSLGSFEMGKDKRGIKRWRERRALTLFRGAENTSFSHDGQARG